MFPPRADAHSLSPQPTANVTVMPTNGQSLPEQSLNLERQVGGGATMSNVIPFSAFRRAQEPVAKPSDAWGLNFPGFPSREEWAAQRAAEREAKRHEDRAAVAAGRKRASMHTFVFRSYELIAESDEADLVRDVGLDLHKAQVKLRKIRARLQSVQEQAAAQVELLTAAERKLSTAIKAAQSSLVESS